MSVTRRQALINAPPARVWDLVGDPSQHSEWWPRVVEVRGEHFDEGDNYAQVTKNARGAEMETTLQIERLDDMRAIDMRCLNTGTYTRWLLTEAQGNTFVEVEFGMEPIGAANRVFDAAFGKIYFSRWLEKSLTALEETSAEADAGVKPSR